jgi:uncharacterized membrane protein YjgN (DUF898 family)
MFAYSMFHRHRHRVRDFFAPRKPRHRFLRVVLALFGIAVLGLLLVIGLAIGVVMLTAGLLSKAWRRRAKPVAADPNTLEGEYRVLRKPVLTTGR